MGGKSRIAIVGGGLVREIAKIHKFSIFLIRFWCKKDVKERDCLRCRLEH